MTKATRPEPFRKGMLILAGLFAIQWALLAIAPADRGDWMLENILVVVIVGVLAWSARAFPLSLLSYALILCFLSLHNLGSHYTYAEVPYDAWARAAFGWSLDDALGFERNHFDRAVHFLYGVLIYYPVREIFVRIAQSRGFWAYMLPVCVVMATSMLFELFEWAAVELVAGDLGMAYLGTQGDQWDAHKDMGLATAGAILALLATAAVNTALGRDVAREWAESLKVRQPEPLGENSLAQRRPHI